MKPFLFVVALALFSGGKIFAQANSDVRAAFLGNNPTATVTTGIGLVVTPVIAPAIQSPLAPSNNAPATSVTQQANTVSKDTKMSGKYELGEVTQKPKLGEDGKPLSKSPLLEGGGLGGGGLSGISGGAIAPLGVSGMVPTQVGGARSEPVFLPHGPTPTPVRIPYATLPAPQRIPYQ